MAHPARRCSFASQEASHLSVCYTLQKICLSTAICTNESISAPNGDLYAAVLYELHAIQTHAEPTDFDVS